MISFSTVYLADILRHHGAINAIEARQQRRSASQKTAMKK